MDIRNWNDLKIAVTHCGDHYLVSIFDEGKGKRKDGTATILYLYFDKKKHEKLMKEIQDDINARIKPDN